MHFTDKEELLKIGGKFNLSPEYLNLLIKNAVSIQPDTENKSLSKIGGDPLLPKDFTPPEDYYFLAQFDLTSLSPLYPAEITKTAFPKSGILSVFISSNKDYHYEDEFLVNPNVKLFYFPEIQNLDVRANFFKTVTRSERAYRDSVPYVVDNQYKISFREQFLSFKSSFSLPRLVMDSYFEVLPNHKDDYDKLEAYLIRFDGDEILDGSNFFGWPSNGQPIHAENYTQIPNFYENHSKIVHLFSFTNDLRIGIDNEMDFQSISVFLFEADLQKGRFDRAWMIPCFD